MFALAFAAVATVFSLGAGGVVKSGSTFVSGLPGFSKMALLWIALLNFGAEAFSTAGVSSFLHGGVLTDWGETCLLFLAAIARASGVGAGIVGASLTALDPGTNV